MFDECSNYMKWTLKPVIALSLEFDLHYLRTLYFSGNPYVFVQMHGVGTILDSRYGYQGLNLAGGNTTSYVEIKKNETFAFDHGFTIEIVVEADVSSLEVVYSDSHFSFPSFKDGKLHIGLTRVSGTYSDTFDMEAHDVYLRPDKIHYYALTFDLERVKVYIDGEKVVDNARSSSMYQVDDSMYIGGDEDHMHDNITLYFMRISNRAKTEAEVNNFANCKCFTFMVLLFTLCYMPLIVYDLIKCMFHCVLRST